MAGLKKIKSHSDAVEYFKELLFYKKYIEKPNIKLLKSIDLLSELPFYEELDVIKTDHMFRGYAINYKVELVGKKDSIDLFSDLLEETKSFKYQITLKVMLKSTSQMEILNLL